MLSQQEIYCLIRLRDLRFLLGDTQCRQIRSTEWPAWKVDLSKLSDLLIQKLGNWCIEYVALTTRFLALTLAALRS